MYTVHLATIKAFGLSDTEYMNRWITTDIEQINLNKKQQQLNNTNLQYDEGKQILNKAKQLFINNKIKNIAKSTVEFGSLSHTQKLKRFKNMHKNKTYIEDEPTLMYKNAPTPKNEALSKHFEIINGPIDDPLENEQLNQIYNFIEIL
eukprot:312375_1